MPAFPVFMWHDMWLRNVLWQGILEAPDFLMGRGPFLLPEYASGTALMSCAWIKNTGTE